MRIRSLFSLTRTFYHFLQLFTDCQGEDKHSFRPFLQIF